MGHIFTCCSQPTYLTIRYPEIATGRLLLFSFFLPALKGMREPHKIDFARSSKVKNVLCKRVNISLFTGSPSGNIFTGNLVDIYESLFRGIYVPYAPSEMSWGITLPTAGSSWGETGPSFVKFQLASSFKTYGVLSGTI